MQTPSAGTKRKVEARASPLLVPLPLALVVGGGSLLCGKAPKKPELSQLVEKAGGVLHVSVTKGGAGSSHPHPLRFLPWLQAQLTATSLGLLFCS